MKQFIKRLKINECLKITHYIVLLITKLRVMKAISISVKPYVLKVNNIVPLKHLSALISLVTITYSCFPQIPTIQLPPAIQEYFNKEPVTTSFADAKTEVNLLANFNPSEDLFTPLNSLARTKDGKYIITPGLYYIKAKSFCMHAGTHASGNHGEGYLYADLIGPKADLIKDILKKWQINAPQVSQHEVQLIIWAIIARVEVNAMSTQFKADLKKILGDNDFKKYNKPSAKETENTAKKWIRKGEEVIQKSKVITGEKTSDNLTKAGEKVEKGIDKADQKVNNTLEDSKTAKALTDIYNAEQSLNKEYKKLTADYNTFENIAMLPGLAPSEFDIRKVSKGAWSYNKAGYFIRFKPTGYASDRVEVYVPQNIQTTTDNSSRIDSIYMNGSISIKFNYADKKDKSGKTVTSVKPSSINVSSIGANKSNLKLQNNFRYTYVGNDDVFDSMATTKDTTLQNFKLDLAPTTSEIHFSLIQNKEKKKIYNLQGIASAFSAFPTTNNEYATASKIKNFITEAANNSIYQSLLSPTNLQGGNIILDLADNVATPANTAMQRLANADDSIEKKECDPLREPIKGDIIIYRSNANSNSPIIHSGVVYEVQNGVVTLVESKWNASGGQYIHPPTISNYGTYWEVYYTNRNERNNLLGRDILGDYITDKGRIVEDLKTQLSLNFFAHINNLLELYNDLQIITKYEQGENIDNEDLKYVNWMYNCHGWTFTNGATALYHIDRIQWIIDDNEYCLIQQSSSKKISK